MIIRISGCFAKQNGHNKGRLNTQIMLSDDLSSYSIIAGKSARSVRVCPWLLRFGGCTAG
ncbi:hypothetical protein [Neisseria sicca]|uniref:hypothetical protein n=1 Tax=Neisseria sicca TaxID=490 RepID=UPI0011BD1FCA|nr:hypothetical protein [Neisseria sicca]